LSIDDCQRIYGRQSTIAGDADLKVGATPIIVSRQSVIGNRQW
jgi:hypothetical protein